MKAQTGELTSALHGGWVVKAALLPGITRYPLYRRLGASPPGFDPRTVQPVASRYTDYAIPAHGYHVYHQILFRNYTLCPPSVKCVLLCISD
jgi:hypothetical protein